MKTIFQALGVLFVALLLMGAGATINGALVAVVDHVESPGLLGVHNSTGYRIAEVEKHLHSNERWFGLHNAPSGEVTRMLTIGNAAVASFQVDAGNDTWGAWVQIVGSSDTPISGTNAYFDLHKIEIVARERNTALYVIQIGCDTSGANALSNGNYTEIPYYSGSALNRSAPIIVQMPRYEDTTKCWARTMCHAQDTATLDFYIGIHEYAG